MRNFAFIGFLEKLNLYLILYYTAGAESEQDGNYTTAHDIPQGMFMSKKYFQNSLLSCRYQLDILLYTYTGTRENTQFVAILSGTIGSSLVLVIVVLPLLIVFILLIFKKKHQGKTYVHIISI